MKSKRLKYKENIYFGIIAFLLFLVGFQYSYDSGSIQRGYNSDLDEMEGGKYLRFVYIGASTCPYCNDHTHEMVGELKEYFRTFAHHYGYKYISTGVSSDNNSTIGVKFLEQTMPYDEVIAGANWYNLGIDHYVWDRFPARASTPQVLLTRNYFNVIPAGREIGNIERNERLLKRLSGINEIEDFYKRVTKSEVEEVKTLIGLSDTE